MRRIVILFALVVTAGCGGGPAPTATETPKEPGATPAESPVEPLVGTWERVTRCEELVSALNQAGLEDWVLESVSGNEFVPGYPDPAHPCKGAVPRVHAHFFTAEGEFGSLDWRGEQVDDGTYEIVDDDTFVVSKEFPDVTFNYTIHGDTIMFEPVVPECSPECFEAAWSVVVAYPGETWERVS